jgi:signal peptide peptidase SppA
MRDLHLLQAIRETPWAMLPEALIDLERVVARHVIGVKLSAAEIGEVVAAAPRPTAKSSGAVAVIPLFGTITQRPVQNISSGGTVATQEIAKALRAAVADPAIKAVVLDVHSPGGSVFGVAELGDEIASLRDQKYIVAVADSLAASAAYWIASQASEVVVTPGGLVGSIGVYVAHVDESKAEELAGVKTTLVSAGKYKVEGHPYGPLGDEARAAMQAQVDDYYDMFVRAVARGRRASPAAVRAGFGEGRVVGAAQAVTLGMADRVATLEQVLAKLGVGPAVQAKPRAESGGPVPGAEAPAGEPSGLGRGVNHCCPKCRGWMERTGADGSTRCPACGHVEPAHQSMADPAPEPVRDPPPAPAGEDEAARLEAARRELEQVAAE